MGIGQAAPLDAGELVVQALGDRANLVVADGDLLVALGQLADGGHHGGGAGAPGLLQLAAFGGGALAGTLLLITYAYLRIPAGMTIVLNFTYPVFVMLITLVSKKERITAVKFISPLLALAGISLNLWKVRR